MDNGFLFFSTKAFQKREWDTQNQWGAANFSDKVILLITRVWRCLPHVTIWPNPFIVTYIFIKMKWLDQNSEDPREIKVEKRMFKCWQSLFSNDYSGYSDIKIIIRYHNNIWLNSAWFSSLLFRNKERFYVNFTPDIARHTQDNI